MLSRQETNRRASQSAADLARSASMSIEEWCAHRRVSRAAFYKMAKADLAPATYYVGSRRYVSAEADARWLAAREATAA